SRDLQDDYWTSAAAPERTSAPLSSAAGTQSGLTRSSGLLVSRLFAASPSDCPSETPALTRLLVFLFFHMSSRRPRLFTKRSGLCDVGGKPCSSSSVTNC